MFSIVQYSCHKNQLYKIGYPMDSGKYESNRHSTKIILERGTWKHMHPCCKIFVNKVSKSKTSCLHCRLIAIIAEWQASPAHLFKLQLKHSLQSPKQNVKRKAPKREYFQENLQTGSHVKRPFWAKEIKMREGLEYSGSADSNSFQVLTNDLVIAFTFSAVNICCIWTHIPFPVN